MPVADPKLIGPLTAEEWCSMRLTGGDEDFLQCCAITSGFRDAVFLVLRMGAEKDCRMMLVHPWAELVDHGMDVDSVPVLRKLADFYGLEIKETSDADSR